MPLAFRAPFVLPTEDKPASVAIADIDGDGKADIVVANSGNGKGRTVGVYRNTTFDRTLSFALPKLVQTLVWPIAIAVADLDRDGKPDLVVAHFTFYQDGEDSGRISIFRNISTPGTIAFDSPVTLSCKYGTRSICVADLDADGRPEIIVTSAPWVVSIFRNSTSQTHLNQASFSTRLDLVVPRFAEANAVIAADLDGDKRTDLIVYGMGNLTIFQNNLTQPSGPMSFSRAINISSDLGQVFGVAAVDVNQDSKLDIAVVENGYNLLSVFLNKSTPGALGESSFSSKVSRKFSGGTFASGVVAEDFDGDGRYDLACGLDGTVVLYQNYGLQPFTTNSLVPVIALPNGDQRPTSIATGDIDGDGRPDLAVANIDNNTVSIFLNSTLSTPYRPSISVTRRADGTLGFRIIGRSGRTATIWSSHDLFAWSRFLSLVNSEGVLDLGDVSPGPSPATFFKVQETPP
jgi:FG-GAP-like repeat